jgi:hypothetical protein
MENIWKIQKTAGAWLLQATTLNNVITDETILSMIEAFWRTYQFKVCKNIKQGIIL